MQNDKSDAILNARNFSKPFSHIHGRRSIHDLNMTDERNTTRLRSNKNGSFDNKQPEKQRRTSYQKEEYVDYNETTEILNNVKYVKVLDNSRNASGDSQYLDANEDILNRSFVKDQSESPQRYTRTNRLNLTLERDQNKKGTNKSSGLSLVYIIFSIIISTIILCFTFTSSTNETDTIVHPFNLEDEIIKISSEFPSQNDELWLSFLSGIQDTSMLSRPSVFILLHSGTSNPSQEIARKVAKVASKALEASIEEPLEIDASILSKEKFLTDHGNVIEDFKPELSERRSMIVNDLHNVHGNVARAFHNFCDKFAPLVGKSVIIFTMKSDSLEGNTVSLAEQVLTEKWSEYLDNDTLLPLLARVTDSVYIVTPESR